MYKQLGFTELTSAIQKAVETNTSLKCYDDIPIKALSPFYHVAIVGKRPNNSKTMYRDVFVVWLHAIAEPSDSSVPIYKLINNLEEALTEDIVLPDGYDLILQTNNGLQTIKTDETNEKHAVFEYEFTVCYGFKSKI